MWAARAISWGGADFPLPSPVWLLWVQPRVGGAGPRVNGLEGGFKDGACQRLYQHGAMRDPTPGGVPAASCLSGMLSKINRWVLHWHLSNYYHCARTQLVRFSSLPFRRGLWLLCLSCSPKCRLHWFSKPDVLGTHFLVQNPQAEEPRMGLRPFVSQGGPLWW